MFQQPCLYIFRGDVGACTFLRHHYGYDGDDDNSDQQAANQPEYDRQDFFQTLDTLFGSIDQ
jgi:hypothetical protein